MTTVVADYHKWCDTCNWLKDIDLAGRMDAGAVMTAVYTHMLSHTIADAISKVKN